MELHIIATFKHDAPAKVVIERRDEWRWYGFLPDQGNQPVSISPKHIGYVGDQAVVRDEHIYHERA